MVVKKHTSIKQRIKYLAQGHNKVCPVRLKPVTLLIFVCAEALHPSQLFFSQVETFSCLPGLHQYYAKDKVSSLRT